MSWLARSIANIQNDVVSYNQPLKTRPEPESISGSPNLGDQEDDVGLRSDQFDNVELSHASDDDDYDDSYGDEARGVKEDLSELTETLTRQFWGVASFLAPPPPRSVRVKCDPVKVNRSLREVEEEELGSWRRGFEGSEVEELENGRGVIKETLENEDVEGFRKWRRGIEEIEGEEEEELRKWRRGIDEKEGEGEEESRSWRRGIQEKELEGEGEGEGELSTWGPRMEERLKNGEEEEELRSCYYRSDDFDVRDEEVVEDAIGVTDEALAFAQNIAHHPETWLDFPIEEDDEEGFEDFQVSDCQNKHALAIQRLVPTLAALRIELCPVHMSEGYFWMVYFVLLHSRLNKNVADQLSSAELVQARSMWREELQKRAKPDTNWFGRSTFYLLENTNSPREDFDLEQPENYDTRHTSFKTYDDGSRPYHESAYHETEKQIVECGEANLVDSPSGNSERDLLAFQSAQIVQDQDDDDDDDNWVQDTEELDGYSATGIAVNEEDVSFSDLEEDSDWTLPIKSK